ncbi:MAG: retroviral-like aspartic protease family protein, partial [Myxococcota bacterium]|nr:retroviral-like aspartic protease family protein [Myxococcota bacterium]
MSGTNHYTNPVGHVIQKVKLAALREEVVAMPVDTGATYSLISPDLADRLGVARFPRKHVITPAGGRRLDAEVGLMMVEIGDRAAATTAIVRPCDEPLLGVEALEVLGLAVDPASGTLVPTRAYAVR